MFILIIIYKKIRLLRNLKVDFIITKKFDYEFGKYIGSGNSGKVYKGFHNTQKIIIKCFSIINYISETELIDDISRELNIYKILKQTTRLVILYGISYHHSNDEKSFYLLMKQ